MNSEVRQCQNCKKQFIIEPEDFLFYEKIQVPPPTFCPECRTIRRMAWRNERSLYKRACAVSGKEVITMFHPQEPIVVYDRDRWWSDDWDQLAAGRAYDFSKPFFVQFRELLKVAPLPNLANTSVVNTPYANHSHDCKDCYLVFASTKNEKVLYSTGAVQSRDSMDLYKVINAENAYEDSFCNSVHKVMFSYNSDESIDCMFLRDCVNVNSSVACVNLRNKSYCFFNRPYTREEYRKLIGKLDLGSYQNFVSLCKRFQTFSLKFPRRYAAIITSVRVTGDMIMESKNLHHSFDVYGGVEDSKFVVHAMGLKDSYDGYGFGAGAELLYEGIDSGIQAARYKFTVYTHGCFDVQYAYCCHASKNLFGCIGLRNKQYCILNKQYTKEEYEILVPQIINHMNLMPYADVRGGVYKYGEFFPTELSPFAYNETIAQEYFPLTKEEAREKGYSWKDLEPRNYQITKTPDQLSDHIRDIPDSITNEIIQCVHAFNIGTSDVPNIGANLRTSDVQKLNPTCNEQCTEAFRVIPQELDFYRKMNLPLPRLCPNCRHYQRLKQRNPLKLWHRKCMCSGAKSEQGKGSGYQYQNTVVHFHGENTCPNEFETSYAPERSEIVYCEQCYQQEVT